MCMTHNHQIKCKDVHLYISSNDCVYICIDSLMLSIFKHLAWFYWLLFLIFSLLYPIVSACLSVLRRPTKHRWYSSLKTHPKSLIWAKSKAFLPSTEDASPALLVCPTIHCARLRSIGCNQSFSVLLVLSLYATSIVCIFSNASYLLLPCFFFYYLELLLSLLSFLIQFCLNFSIILLRFYIQFFQNLSFIVFFLIYIFAIFIEITFFHTTISYLSDCVYSMSMPIFNVEYKYFN